MNDSGVITHGDVDRGYKLCRCACCGEVSLCTPDNDFYTRVAEGLLYCESCILHPEEIEPLKGRT